MMWKHSLDLALLFAVITIAPDVCAQKALPLPPSVKLSIPPIAQDSVAWCSTADTDMTIKYRQPTGTCCGKARMCMRLTAGWNNPLSMDYRLGVDLSSLNILQNSMTLFNLLGDNYPIVWQIRTGNQLSHFIDTRRLFLKEVDVDYHPNSTPIIDRTAYVSVNDPLSATTEEYSYTQLRSGW
jgi:hypothetical protein